MWCLEWGCCMSLLLDLVSKISKKVTLTKNNVDVSYSLSLSMMKIQA